MGVGAAAADSEVRAPVRMASASFEGDASSFCMTATALTKPAMPWEMTATAVAADAASIVRAVSAMSAVAASFWLAASSFGITAAVAVALPDVAAA